MLGDILNQQTASLFFDNNSQPQQQPQQSQQPTNVPGVVNGAPPVMQSAPQSTTSQAEPEGTIDIKAELEKYKASDDNTNTGNGEDQQPDEFTLPNSEEFNNFAQRLSSNIQIDPEAAQAALGGDVDSFNKVLNTALTQVIGMTMQNASAAALQMYKTLNEQTTDKVANTVSSQQTQSEIMQTAAKIDPKLPEDPLRSKLFNTAVTDLRTQYPTAPKELLAKFALQSLGVNVAGTPEPNKSGNNYPQPQAQQEETNWIKHTSGS